MKNKEVLYKIYIKCKPYIFLNLGLLLFLLVLIWIKPASTLKKYDIYPPNESLKQFNIWGDVVLYQWFECSEVENGLELYVLPVNNSYHGSFNVRLLDEDSNIFGEWIIDKLDIDNDRINLKLKDDRTMMPECRYCLEVSASGLTKDNGINVYILDSREYGSQRIGNMIVENMEEPGADLSGKALGFGIYRAYRNIFAELAIIIVFLIANIYQVFKDKGVDKLALPMLMSCGMIMLLIMAPASGLDEDYHYYSAFKLSNMIMGRSNADEVENKYRLTIPIEYNANSTFVRVIEEIRYRTAGEEGVFIYDGDKDPLIQPLSHLAPALGLTVGRLLNMNFIQIYTMGRIFNMCFYVLLAYAAVRLVPVNKELMLLIAMMPMAMHQSAQLSYDAVVNGMSLLFIGYILMIMFREKKFSWKDIFICIVILGLMGPIKIVYSLLAIIILAVPDKRFRSVKDRIIKLGTPILGGFIVLLILKGTTIITNITDANGNVGWAEETYTLGYVFAEPVRYLKLLLSSIESTMWPHMTVSVGSLASGDLLIPEYIVIFYMTIMVLCAISDKSGTYLSVRQKAVFCSTFVIGIIALYVVFSFNCTGYGDTKIVGVHGRYFIPFIPLLMYSLLNDRIRTDIKREYLFVPIWFVFTAYIVSVMSSVVMFL